MTEESATRHQLTRRDFLVAAGALAATIATVDGVFLEPRDHEITRHEIGAPSGRPIRIVQLSDLHLRALTAHVGAIAASVWRLKPDLIVLTGDIIEHQPGIQVLDRFFTLMPTGVPTVAILGNWDHRPDIDQRALAATYARHHVELLVNRSMTLRYGDRQLLITGMDSARDGLPDLSVALRGATPAPNHLLLIHTPPQRDHFLRDAQGPAFRDTDPRLLRPSLALAGHTHGGQVTLGGHAIVLPQGSGGYVHGWYRDSPTPLYVSRGIGTSGIPVRLGARPEIAVFDWRLS